MARDVALFGKIVLTFVTFRKKVRSEIIDNRGIARKFRWFNDTAAFPDAGQYIC